MSAFSVNWKIEMDFFPTMLQWSAVKCITTQTPSNYSFVLFFFLKLDKKDDRLFTDFKYLNVWNYFKIGLMNLKPMD